MTPMEAIRERLSRFAPQTLELHDDSREHAGHAGAQGGGGHYHLLIVSEQFFGKSPVARHRMIYDAVSDMMKRDIHALSIKAYTPREFDHMFSN